MDVVYAFDAFIDNMAIPRMCDATLLWHFQSANNTDKHGGRF